MIKVLDEDVLDSQQNFTYVLIDDLDRDWVDDRLANDLIRCLFRAVIDLQRVKNLKVIVALRTNIFENLHFGAKTGGQEEKFRSLALRMTWSKRTLQNLLDERVRVASQDAAGAERLKVSELLPKANVKRGDPVDYILERTLMRPRDCITYLNECLRQSSNMKQRLSWDDIVACEEEYSNNRFLALRDEWKPSFPGIDRVLNLFKDKVVPIEPHDLSQTLDDAILLMADPDFEGTPWMESLSEPVWTGEKDAQWWEVYQPIIRLLYRIGFIGCRMDGKKNIYAHADINFADKSKNIQSVTGFHVHPAFQHALDIQESSPGISLVS